MEDTDVMQTKCDFISTQTRVLRWVCFIAAVLVSLGTAFFEIVSGGDNLFFSFVIVPAGFAIASLVGTFWLRFVVWPIHCRRLRKSKKPDNV